MIQRLTPSRLHRTRLRRTWASQCGSAALVIAVACSALNLGCRSYHNLPESIGNNTGAIDAVGVIVTLKGDYDDDKAKFALPDAYKTELTWTINARSLQNFLYLRTSTAAMWEIRKLAYAVYDALPEDHKYLYAGCMTSRGDTSS